MQSTKKLVLVDEFDREYKRLQRPTAAVAKANHSLSLSNTLRNSSLADDRKVRQYVEELHRYLNVNKPTDQSTPAINWVTEPERVQPRKQTVEKQKKKKKKRVAMPRTRTILHSTFPLALPVVFRVFVICNVTAGVPRLR